MGYGMRLTGYSYAYKLLVPGKSCSVFHHQLLIICLEEVTEGSRFIIAEQHHIMTLVQGCYNMTSMLQVRLHH
jgi:hypothetical protein